jgi:hypothetical protein
VGLWATAQATIAAWTFHREFAVMGTSMIGENEGPG